MKVNYGLMLKCENPRHKEHVKNFVGNTQRQKEGTPHNHNSRPTILAYFKESER